MTSSRKTFLATAAVGASLAAVADFASCAPAGAQERVPIHFPVLGPHEYDRAAMMKVLSKSSPHRQVFQSVSPTVIVPGVASLYLHMQNSMNAYEFSLGLGTLEALGVLIGPSCVLALNDAMWTKYAIGKNAGESPLAATNIYYKATSPLKRNVKPDDPAGIYQDWSAEALMKRGASFFVCANALFGLAASISQKAKTALPDTLADFKRNLLPGIIMVPAGVAAVQQAQEMGWKIYPLI